MLRVGLTGGIACGKSHVLGRLASAGFHTLDLDVIGHEVLAPGGAAHAQIVGAFGEAVLAPDGSVDRKALGALVFADPAARARLNAIVHPKIREEEARRAAAYAGEPGAVVVTDAALLVESGVHLRFDRLVVVHCGEDEQLRRLMVRDGIEEGPARGRLSAQMPVSEKRRFAHFEVDASGSLDETYRAVDSLAARLRGLLPRHGPRVLVPSQRALGCLLHGPAHGPRRVEPIGLLREIVAARGLEMERMARLLVPPTEGPWYHAARQHEPGPGPEALAGPVVLWALTRGAPDPAFLMAAMSSIARLTRAEPEAIAVAGLFALALQQVAITGRVPEDLLEKAAGWRGDVEPWGGTLPRAALAPVFDTACRHPNDVPAARGACLAAGGDADLAGALVGMAVGVPVAEAPEPLARVVRALEGLASEG